VETLGIYRLDSSSRQVDNITTTNNNYLSSLENTKSTENVYCLPNGRNPDTVSVSTVDNASTESSTVSDKPSVSVERVVDSTERKPLKGVQINQPGVRNDGRVGWFLEYQTGPDGSDNALVRFLSGEIVSYPVSALVPGDY
jgi:hypothetical protein